MTALTITVQGSASIHRAPELGAVSLSLGFEGVERTEVLERTGALHAAVSTVLDERRAEPAEGITSWSAGQVQVWGQRPWNAQGEQLDIVYHSAASVSATFTDFTRLSAWVDDVSTWDGVTVLGVTWTLSDDHTRDAETESLRSAIADAVRKAEVYAESLGLLSVTAVAISDPGLLSSEQGPQAFASDGIGGSPRMMKAAMSTSGGGVSLQPEDLVFEVQVHARFTAS
ncbi:SIMPL domain-containing protein [Plantibacter sp. YIM 135347]|uniref:SIMPL domain-containing protein n=1 Tax=Plantibacter sp. YIM 135347 TaxID=3423919 RepID=UPI003D328824